jgi:hypothetical protein
LKGYPNPIFPHEIAKSPKNIMFDERRAESEFDERRAESADNINTDQYRLYSPTF